MLTDEFLERIFANEEMQKIPIGCQSTAVHTSADSGTFRLCKRVCCTTNNLRAINGEGTAVAPGSVGGDA